MNCEEIRSLVPDLLEGRLGGARASVVRRHLGNCSECAARLGAVDRVELLPLLDEAVEPSKSLESRFHARLAGHRSSAAAQRPSLAGRLVSRVNPPRLALAGALIAVLAVAVILGVRPAPVQAPPSSPGEYGVAENLPLLQDLDVVQNLDLLQNLDEIQALDEGVPKPEAP